MSDSPTTTVERTETPRIAANVERTAEGLFAPSHGSASLPPVLDACCGGRGMWMNKKDPRAIYVDKRSENFGKVQNGQTLDVNPDIVADFTALPFPDDTFSLVVLDPPHHTHKRMGKSGKGCMTMKYGVLLPGWETMLQDGFRECFRVLKPHGTLIFKWCSYEIPLKDVLALTDVQPLFGHNSGKQMLTHWVAFLKPNEQAQ